MIYEKTAWVVFPRLLIPGIISKYSLLDVICQWPKIGPCILMSINATTRQQISIYSIGPYWYLLACTPHIWKSGGTKNPVLYPHLKIRGGAPGNCSLPTVNFRLTSLNSFKFYSKGVVNAPLLRSLLRLSDCLSVSIKRVHELRVNRRHFAETIRCPVKNETDVR